MSPRGCGQALCMMTCAAVVTGSACGKKSGPPPLPPIPTLSAEIRTGPAKNVEYRSQAGEAIAPVVIADDPAPVVVQQPAPSGTRGPATLNGDPNGLTRESLNLAIQGAMGSLASCFTSLTQEPMVAISFEADPSGRPSLLRVNGAPPDAEHCIRRIVQGVRFPAFQGKGVPVDLPLSFHRVTRPPQPSSPSGQEQQQGPPLYLQP